MRMTPRPRVLAEFFLGVSVEFLKRHDIRMLRGNPLDCLRMPLGVILESDKHIVGENPEFGFRSGWLRVHQSNADETQANDPCEDRGDSRFRDFDAGEGIHGLLVVMSFSLPTCSMPTPISPIPIIHGNEASTRTPTA